MYVDVARDFAAVVLPPHSFNLNFQVVVFVKLFRCFDGGVGVEGYSHINEKAGFVLLVL